MNQHKDQINGCALRADKHFKGSRTWPTLVFFFGLLFLLNFVVFGDSSTTTVDSNNNPSTYGQSVTFTATVAPPGATGTVTFKDGGTDISGAISVASGQAQFSTSSLSAGSHSITAHYSGDGTYLPSTSSSLAQVVNKGDVSITLTCTPATAFIFQPVTCHASVTDALGGPVPTGTVVFDNGGKPGAFPYGSTGVLDSLGNCSVTYLPGALEAGNTTITATYQESATHKTGAASQLVVVKLRPTETTVVANPASVLVNENSTVTIVVKDVAGVGTASSPGGSLAISNSLTPLTDMSWTVTSSFGADASDSSKEVRTYRRTGLDKDGDMDTVGATYTASDGIHAGSSGAYAVAIQRRPTTTTITPTATTDGYDCDVTVADAGTAGTASTPGGDVRDGGTNDFLCSLTSGSGSFSKTTSLLYVMVAVQYDPTDRVHLKSFASEALTRDGAGMLPELSCGALDVQAIITGLNTGVLACDIASTVLDAAELVLDVIPDPFVGGGVFVVSGVTIPISDIIAAVVGVARIAMNVYSITATTDLDADGLPGILEAVVGTSDTDPDSDDDGMGDWDEIDWAGGLHGSAQDPAAACGCPSPEDDNSDNDGVLDGDEVAVYSTDPCNPDTDGDGLSDGDEVDTWGCGDPRDHADPIMIDTDGDGLNDNRELSFFPACASCPYVNDDDSDDDGLQDGYEDKDKSGTITNTIGDSATQGSGETDFCNPDTDSDGLLDGEEEALFGQGVVTAVTPAGSVTTIPALDDDSDNDGLFDYEEVNITHTDPLNWDSDGDTISDANELICTGGFWPKRTFDQESDPLDIDTDDDDLTDDIEYDGTGLGITRDMGGTRDTDCPFVNDDDSDDDGLQDGVEDADKDGVYDAGLIGGLGGSQSPTKGGSYWETNLCNCDTDGDGLLDGEEVGLLGGAPLSSTPGPGETFSTVSFELVSTTLPVGTSTVPGGYSYSGSPGTSGSLIAPYTFAPAVGTSTGVTVPALDVDSDDDGLSDYEEVNITGTDPLDQDTDNDTLMDSQELIATGGTTGPTPRRTFDQESDPLDINTDGDGLFDPQEYYNAGQYGSGLSITAGGTGGTRDVCPFVNDDDSDDDGIQDGTRVIVDPALTITGTGVAYDYSYTHYEDFIDVAASALAFPGIAASNVGTYDGEQRDDSTWNVCDPDSDGDGLNDGEEIAIGTNPDDCDTDDDGRNDWHEVTGGGPIPTDPFDPDTDDDGLLDSAEVFGANPTNPLNADTDGDGLCDGGTGTPWMTSGDARVIVNPICKSCAVPGLTSCVTSIRTGSVDGIGDHPNPHGYGEDKDGDGSWDGTIGQLWVSGVQGTPETDPNQYDTDGDAEGDGIEVLGFSTSRQSWIPATDLFGRTINVTYPACGCLEPLIADTDGDGLSDGYEDNNHDGNFDFLPSDFEHEQDPLPGPPQPNPNETNPCDPDTDDDDLTDYEERYQSQVFEFYANWDNDGDGLYNEDPFVDGIDEDGDGLDGEDPVEPTFNPTNPLDHDTDNDWLLDGFEVKYVCVALTCSQLDNDTDALINEDPIDGIDNDEDGLLDEDPVDFTIRFVPMLDPTCRDSDSDGYLDGLDENPCNSECIPVLSPVEAFPVDTDGDGFSDEDEIFAGTHPNDPEDHPIAFYNVDLDFDQWIDDRVWLEPTACCGPDVPLANSVVIDIDSNVLIDFRLQIVEPRDVRTGDFDGDGAEDDTRYIVEYAFANYRVLQPRIVATIDDYNTDLVIDWVVVERK